MLRNLALSMDLIPLRMASPILCLVAVVQYFQWRRPLEMRKSEPKTAFLDLKSAHLEPKFI